MADAVNVKKFAYNDFKNKKILGEGSFNQVYYAEHPELRSCVVKIVTRAFFAKPKQKKKLEEEAEHMFSIKHSNLIKGYGIVMEPNHLCLVYEYAKYGCLADILRRIPEHFSWALKVRTAFQTASAINFLHSHSEHLIHRNLKSTNILFDDDINVKVSDFITPKSTVWMSQATQQKEITERKKIADGNPPVRKGRSLAHIPPEIVQNINTQAVESYDMYSYGVVLWELLTEKRPFDGATTEEVYRKMSEGFVHPFDVVLPGKPQYLFDIMKAALNLNAALRPSFQVVCTRLKSFNDEQATTARVDAVKCRDAYDGYKATKREKLTSTSRQVSQETGGAKPTTTQTPQMEPVSEGWSKKQRAFAEPELPPSKKVIPDNEIEGQIIKTSATIADECISVQSHETPAASKYTLKRPSQSTDADEKMDIEVSKENQQDEEMSAVSYSESGSNFEKAIPFIDNDSPPPTGGVRIAPTRQAVYNIQGEHITLHVGDNMAPSAGAPDEAPPHRPDQNVHIIAAGSHRPLTLQDKYVIVNNAGPSNWKRLARHMKFSESSIEAIDYDYDKEGLREKIYQVVHRWTDKCRGQATVGGLVDVLKEANMHDIAQLLQP